MRAISQIPVSFIYQSYFDSTLLQAAILEQPPNMQIVPSTKKDYQGKVHAVALASGSDCPITVKFQGGRDSGHYLLRPGEIIRPGECEGFTYGLPFGWLGGGLAMLKVAHTDDARLDPGPGRPEVIFHRTRLQIVADAALGGISVVNNWPGRFPWTQATRGSNAIDQRGASLLTVEPTKVLLRLRLNDTTGKTVRFAFRGSHDFDQTSTGTVGTTDAEYVDVNFPANASLLSLPYPMVALPAEFARLACDEGGVTVLDLGDAALTSQYIDVVRYGRI